MRGSWILHQDNTYIAFERLVDEINACIGKRRPRSGAGLLNVRRAENYQPEG